MARLPGLHPHARRLELVEDAFRTLPERYLGAHPGFDVTYHVRLGDVGRTWEVRCTEHSARVRRGATRREPDVVIGTDATTWLRLRRGDLSGIEAFSQRLLYVRGISIAPSASKASGACPTAARRCCASTTCTCRAAACRC